MRKKSLVIAVRPMRYAGKALRAGDQFEPSERDAKLLTAARLATYATRGPRPKRRARQVDAAPEIASETPAPASSEPAAQPAAAPDAQLTELRTLYEQLSGKKAHGFWRVKRLEAEIAELTKSGVTQ